MIGLRIAGCLTLSALLIGCGGGSSSGINANFVGDLRNPDNSPAFSFFAHLSQGSGTTLNISNFDFSTPTACFSGSTIQTASYSSVNFDMTISSGPGAQANTIKMQGKQSTQGFQGTWTLMGLPACNGGGTFILMGLPPV